MTTTRYATALLLLAATGSALAEGEKPAATPPGAPRPSKELEAFMKPLEGSWKCDERFPAGAFGPGSPEVNARSTVRFRRDYDGFIYRGEYELKKQKGLEIPELPMKGVFVLAWDPGAREMLVSQFNSNGSMSMATGKPQGDTLITIGDLCAGLTKIKARTTYIAKSGRESFHRFELDTGKGWRTIDESLCTR
jgi:hypothetical protein